MRHVMVPFSVAPESIDETKVIISAYVKEIRKNEPKTMFYKSFQRADDGTRFVHVMTFEDAEGENFHKGTEHNRIFIEALYPLCTEMPKAIIYNEIV